jgi:hypothetical protein
MTAFDQIKTFARRDSATALLKKLGVLRADYDQFIEAADGQFIVKQAAAVAFVAAKTAPKGRVVNGAADPHAQDADELDESASLAAAKTAKKTAKAKAPTTAKRTVTSAALELIRAGKTNVETFATLQTEFSLGDDKKTYPAWYRRHLLVKFGEDYSATAGAVVRAAKPVVKVSAKAPTALEVATTAVKKAAETSNAIVQKMIADRDAKKAAKAAKKSA